MQQTYTLAEINRMDPGDFVEVLGSIYEHSPHIAAETFKARPFSDLNSLQQAMFQAVEALSDAEQLRLIRNHPRLGRLQNLTLRSEQEQRQAGLDRLAQEEQKELERLNAAYEAKFGFPFVVAVRLLKKGGVLQELGRRLVHDATTERTRAIQEIHAIAGLRLQEIVR